MIPERLREGLALLDRIKDADEDRRAVILAGEAAALRSEIDDAYAEIRKQVVGSRVVFDRDLVRRAMKAGGETYADLAK
jgi:flavin-dependent dehydrogenase